MGRYTALPPRRRELEAGKEEQRHCHGCCGHLRKSSRVCDSEPGLSSQATHILLSEPDVNYSSLFPFSQSSISPFQMIDRCRGKKSNRTGLLIKTK